MKLLKIEFGFQPRSTSGVQSEVQFKVQSYCLGWYFQMCYQKIVGKWFFTIFWYNKDKNITSFDTNWFQNVAVVVGIVVDIVVVVALAVVVSVRFAVLLLL